MNIKIRILWIFFGCFRLWDTFQRTNCAEFTTDGSRQAAYEMKFSAMNVDFNGPSLDLLGSWKPAHESIIERYPRKVVIWLLLASLPWKQLQIGMDMLPITTSPSDELFSRINIDEFERPWTPKLSGFNVFFAIFGCAAHFKSELWRGLR